MLVAHLTCQTLDSIQPGRATPPSIKLAASLFSVAFCVALVQAVAYSRNPPVADQQAVADATVNAGGVNPVLLNLIAWQYATAASPSREELGIALRAAESASTLEPDEMAFLDTLATVHYRYGNIDRAIDLERRVLGKHASDDTILTQVARFLDARLERRGPLQLGEGANAESVSVEPSPDAPTRGQLILRVGQAYPNGAEIFVLGESGLLILGLGPTHEAGELRFTPDGVAQLKGAQRWRTALVDTTTCARCVPGTVRGEYHPRNQEVMALPGPTRR